MKKKYVYIMDKSFPNMRGKKLGNPKNRGRKPNYLFTGY